MEEGDIAPDPDTAIHYITTPHREDMDLELDYGRYFALNTVLYVCRFNLNPLAPTLLRDLLFQGLVAVTLIFGEFLEENI